MLSRILLGGIALLLLAAPSQAVELVTIKPATGSTLTSVPTQVTLQLDGPVADQGNEVQVSDNQGNRVDDGSLEISGNKVLIGIKIVSDGNFSIKYQVMGQDGSVLTGTSAFSITNSVNPSPSSSMTPTPTETLPPLVSEKKGFWNALKNGGSGILLGVLILLVLLSRLARRQKSKRK